MPMSVGEAGLEGCFGAGSDSAGGEVSSTESSSSSWGREGGLEFGSGFGWWGKGSSGGEKVWAGVDSIQAT